MEAVTLIILGLIWLLFFRQKKAQVEEIPDELPDEDEELPEDKIAIFLVNAPEGAVTWDVFDPLITMREGAKIDEPIIINGNLLEPYAVISIKNSEGREIYGTLLEYDWVNSSAYTYNVRGDNVSLVNWG